MQELLKELVSLPAACGNEQAVIRHLRDRLAGKVDHWHVDGIGNLIVMKRGAHPGPTLMLSGHADEVGFVVKRVEPSGLIRFEKIGGHDDRIIPCEQVVVNTRRGPRLGLIGAISVHFLKFDDPQRVRPLKELYIDVGARDAEGVAELGIEVGDSITWATPFEVFGQGRAVGHGFDDKAGCALIAKVMEDLDWSRVHGTVWACFSVQEELGLRGAHVASNQIAADVALAVDTTAVSDTPEGIIDNTLELGKGPAVKYIDFSMSASRAVVEKLEQAAREAGIAVQREIFYGIGTDAGEMHKAGAGVPSGVISIPSRYAHSPNEVIDLKDYEACRELLETFIYALRDKADFAFIEG